MKSNLRKILSNVAVYGVAVSAAMGLIACGTTNNNSQVPPGLSCVGYGCVTGTGGNSVPPTFNSGDTEPWTPVNNTVLGTYVGYPLNSPTNFIVNIALNPSGTNQYNGVLTIQFTDGSTVHNGTFSNGNGSEKYNGYNQSVNELVPNTNTYRVYFEDPMGAIILTMTKQGGTDTNVPLSGSIYFLNFNSNAPNPLYQGAYDQYGNYFPPGLVFCWMIDYGPYACTNNNLPPTTPQKNKQGDWTVPGYTLLGTIPTINQHNALGI